MRTALYPWQQTRVPCSHASIREVRELYLSSGVCHQSHTSWEKDPQMVSSLFCLAPFLLFEERESMKRGFFPVKQSLFLQKVRLSSYRGITSACDPFVWWQRMRQRVPCALLIQASLRSIRLLIMRHVSHWYKSRAICGQKRRMR